MLSHSRQPGSSHGRSTAHGRGSMCAQTQPLNSGISSFSCLNFICIQPAYNRLSACRTNRPGTISPQGRPALGHPTRGHQPTGLSCMGPSAPAEPSSHQASACRAVCSIVKAFIRGTGAVTAPVSAALITMAPSPPSELRGFSLFKQTQGRCAARTRRARGLCPCCVELPGTGSLRDQVMTGCRCKLQNIGQ